MRQPDQPLATVVTAIRGECRVEAIRLHCDNTRRLDLGEFVRRGSPRRVAAPRSWQLALAQLSGNHGMVGHAYLSYSIISLARLASLWTR